MSEEQDEPVQEIIGGADAAKASAALNALDRHDDDNEASNKTADAEALGKAMKDLDNQEVPAEKKKEASKKVKVDAADVALLVSEFEVTKVKATEMLRAYDGDAVKTMSAYITTPI